MPESEYKNILQITTENEAYVIEWLNDRQDFHKWFTTLIIASFVLLTIFGNKPGFGSIGPVFLTAALISMLLAILCNLVCVWSIPGWKLKVRTGITTDGRELKRELGITAWIGVLSFVIGLTLGFIGNLPG
ncbi:MAG: hypothetical protein GY935_00180 [Gammaproteobacteria bacterium]|nr:hypothetical protein [Gammaproteobacteria bacterium]